MSTRTELWVRRGYKPYAIKDGKELVSYPWGNGVGGPISINARTVIGDPTSMMTYEIAGDGKLINAIDPGWLACESCGKQKADVCVRPDGYRQDVNNEEDAEWTACDDCNYENNMDI